MGGPGSGRYPRKKGSPRPNVETPMTRAHDPNVENRELHHRAMEFGKELIAFDEPDWTDEQELMDRFYRYLELCDKWGIRPMVSSMAQAFGMNRKQLWGVATRNEHYKHWKGITPKCVDVIQKAYNFLETNLEISLMEEQKNPVKWFFLAKNYFGFEDQTVRVERKEAEVTLLPNPDDVVAKYALQVGRPALNDSPIEVEAEVVDLPNDSREG